MATEAQLRANRQNAQHSTGPKTDAGKARSRGNALSHGLAGGGAVVAEARQAEVDARLTAWSACLAPETEVEAFLALTAVRASVQLDHAHRHRVASQSRRVRHAGFDWDVARRREVEALVADLDTSPDPRPLVSRLLDTADGCAWMIAEWSELDGLVEGCGLWHVPHRARALTLLGERRTEDDPGPRTVALLKLEAGLAQDPGLEALINRDDLSAADEARLDAYAEAQSAAVDAIRRFIASEVTALEARRALLDAEHDAPDRAEAVEVALIDPRADMALRRYETAAARQLHVALDDLAKSRKAALAGSPRAGRAVAAPIPAPAPSPDVVVAKPDDGPPSPPPPREPRPEPAVSRVPTLDRPSWMNPARNEPNSPASSRLGMAWDAPNPDPSRPNSGLESFRIIPPKDSK